MTSCEGPVMHTLDMLPTLCSPCHAPTIEPAWPPMRCMCKHCAAKLALRALHPRSSRSPAQTTAPSPACTGSHRLPTAAQGGASDLAAVGQLVPLLVAGFRGSPGSPGGPPGTPHLEGQGGPPQPAGRTPQPGPGCAVGGCLELCSVPGRQPELGGCLPAAGGPCRHALELEMLSQQHWSWLGHLQGKTVTRLCVQPLSLQLMEGQVVVLRTACAGVGTTTRLQLLDGQKGGHGEGCLR